MIDPDPGVEVDMSVNTGVYFILNIVNWNIYVGSTGISFSTRWAGHRSDLRGSRHGNRPAQRMKQMLSQENKDKLRSMLIEYVPALGRPPSKERLAEIGPVNLIDCLVNGSEVGLRLVVSGVITQKQYAEAEERRLNLQENRKEAEQYLAGLLGIA